MLHSLYLLGWYLVLAGFIPLAELFNNPRPPVSEQLAASAALWCLGGFIVWRNRKGIPEPKSEPKDRWGR